MAEYKSVQMHVYGLVKDIYDIYGYIPDNIENDIVKAVQKGLADVKNQTNKRQCKKKG